jgi:predicted alpha/beta-hydrolase family hydrolase
VATYHLSDRIRVHWIEDGDHSFKPRVRSGRTLEQNLEEALDATAAFVAGLR